MANCLAIAAKNARDYVAGWGEAWWSGMRRREPF